MKRSIFISIIVFLALNLNSQTNRKYLTTENVQQNINYIKELAPYSDGAVGFDTRYEGIKGSVRLFEKLIPALMKVDGQDYYIKLNADIDAMTNQVLFNHPASGKLMTFPAESVIELIFPADTTSDIVFRPTKGMAFEKEQKGTKLVQIISETPVLFIKMTSKNFIEADYQRLYSADRKFDEYETKIKYFISGNDNLLHEVKLNRNALSKLFPDKKDYIKKTIDEGKFANNEEMVVSILENIKN